MAAYYRATLAEFLGSSEDEIFLPLLRPYNELKPQQREAWEIEVKVLKAVFYKLVEFIAVAKDWSLLLEYPIPRRSKRLDAILLADDVIICLEFKTGDQIHSPQIDRQIEDYALDLRDFHKESNNRRIVPISVVPKAPVVTNQIETISKDDAVRDVKRANESDLATIISTAYRAEHRDDSRPINASAWDESTYHPVPTIIEAAESLYGGHKVEEIAHSYAGNESLATTSNRLIKIIQEAQQRKERVICFVTGIPGAGKTLVGLSLVHNPILRGDGSTGGVFLSGNKPLVDVVSAAIKRDKKRREKERDAERVIGTRIQNIHTVIKDALSRSGTPLDENIVIFDEAQRAWNAKKNFKKNKRDISEPETVLSILNRHKEWTVLIALVGGGQEIHDGEAGLSEWGRVLKEKYSDWKIVVSPKALEEDTNIPGNRLFADGNNGSLSVKLEESLHLNVNQRSFRAQRFAEWVNAALACNPAKAAEIIPDLQNFPFALTRSLETARNWLRKNVRGQKRAGLVASSGSLRLRAEGIELSAGFRQGNRDMFVNWFLNLPPDVRSSNQLEIAASEFECQGLELDWVGLCWGGDFSFDSENQRWKFQNFAGTRWGIVQNEIDRQYLLNTYRVLLTRARQGLVIWVPKGDDSDPTRLPSFFDPTANYLQSCGVPVV